MTESERRRRRPVVSCSSCRKRKIRCNRELPCSNCIRSRHQTCVYDDSSAQPPRQHQRQDQSSRASSTSARSTVSSHPPSSLVAGPTNVSSVATQPSPRDAEAIQGKAKQLEEDVPKAVPRPVRSHFSTPGSNVETTTSHLGGILFIHHEGNLEDQPQAIARSVTHKTRLFGQTHWMNIVSLIQDICEYIEPHLREDFSGVNANSIQRCKSLARVIKSGRTPPWPSPPKTDLPTKDVADELVDCYLRTTETVYRILHIPTFKKMYEALWVSGSNSDAAFLVQLKLILAIGATAYDEQFSLRTLAIRWVYEAQTWISEPNFKPRLDIQSLQTEILLLFARETVDIGGDSIWISAGSLLRKAVYMGLHRDPKHLPTRTTPASEMRRRLWNTILEVTLQSSLICGGPPLLSLDDFDTEPPGNFDDDQLVAEDPVPKPKNAFTQVSIAIALRETFPLRLMVTKFLNDLGSHGTYEETLRLDAELRESYKILCKFLQEFTSSAGPSPSRFELRMVHFIMHRYFSSLHIPFFGPALHETAYAYSRKVVVEASLRIWCAAYPSSSLMVSQSCRSNPVLDKEKTAQLTVCGCGYLRSVAIQAVVIIAVELRAQLQEDEGLGPIPLRPDLLSVLEEAKALNLQWIEAGETSVKGYLLTSVLDAHIKGLMRGLGKDQFPQLIIKTAEKVEQRCLPILEDMASKYQAEGTADELHQLSLSTSPEALENWDFMMSDVLLNPGTADPMSWMLSDETMQVPPFW
ncbi:hypothetical protein F5B20DRAFT_591586 [Whalleya microplaca]|nr:hypothetical protein F5B20DRAFT_591586 [Whalleya microplaca]